MRFTSLIFLLTSLFCCVFSLSLWAGTVSQVKGSKMIIQLEGESASPGNEYFILNSAGKRVGLVTIKQVKGTKALAELTKGRANAGDSIQAKGASTSASQSSSAAASETSTTTSKKSTKSTGKYRVGALLGYAMNTFSLSVQDKTNTALKEDVTMKDSTFNLKGFYDYDLSPEFTIRGAAGYESFAAKGTTTASICSNGSSTECSVKYDYLALEGSAHYNFLTGPTRVWVGLGYSFLIAMTKSSNIPNLTESSTNQMILFSGGTDISMGPSSFIPLVVEYGMFPGSSNVTANSIFLRGGYGMTF
ncbi:MAG: hypothetical protein ACAH59_04885 [Pseudobdellovibrionaceae bacterium]